MEDRSAGLKMSKTNHDSQNMLDGSITELQNQTVSKNTDKYSMIGQSGLVHSQLLKYQCTKNVIPSKSKQKKQKLDILNRLITQDSKGKQSVSQNKNFFNQNSLLTTQLPLGSIPYQNLSQQESQIQYLQKLQAQSSINSNIFLEISQDISQKQKINDSQILQKSYKFNLGGSLPQIKQQLDRKQFSILKMVDEQKQQNGNLYSEDDHNLQTQHLDQISDNNIYQQRDEMVQEQIILHQFNHSQDSSLMNINSNQEMNNQQSKTSQNKNFVYIGENANEQPNNSIRSQFGTMKGSQTEKEGEQDQMMRVSGVKLQTASQILDVNKTRSKTNYQMKKIQNDIAKKNQHVSPIRTLIEFDNNTPIGKELNIALVESQKKLEDENFYQNEVYQDTSKKQYYQYYNQNVEFNQGVINQPKVKSNNETFYYGERQNRGEDQQEQNQAAKQSITKSSRISIFSNQQNKTFSNNYKKSEDFIVKQNSGNINSSKSSQARSENFIRIQNLQETIISSKLPIQQSQTQFNQSYSNFKEIEEYKTKKNQVNNWKKTEEEISQNSGAIKGNLMNLSAIMNSNMPKNNKETSDSEEKIKLKNDLSNYQNMQFADTLVNETQQIEQEFLSTNKSQLKEKIIKSTIVQIENSRNKINQNLDILQQQSFNLTTDKAPQINLKNYNQKFDDNSKLKFVQKNHFPVLDHFKEDKGYHSSNDPYMDKVSSELYNQILKDHFVRKGCWIPSRFKMFPRFAIFTNKNKKAQDDNFARQNEQYISLSSKVLALLAGVNIKDQQGLNSFLQQPAVINNSINLVHAANNSNKNTLIDMTPASQFIIVNARNDTEGTAQLEQSYEDKNDFKVQKGNQENQTKIVELLSTAFDNPKQNANTNVLIKIQSDNINIKEYIDNKVGTERLQNYHLSQLQNKVVSTAGTAQSDKNKKDLNRQSQSKYKTNNDESSFKHRNQIEQQKLDVLICDDNILRQNNNNKFSINQHSTLANYDLEQNQFADNENQIIALNNIGQITSELQSQNNQEIKFPTNAILSQKFSDYKSNPVFNFEQQFEEDTSKQIIIKQFDPFNKVVLTKGMDNQILTSYRTIIKSNNMLSNTLKVVHQRFLARALNKSLISRLPRGKHLYPISLEILQKFTQEMLIQNELESMNDLQRKDLINNLEQLNQLSKHYDIDDLNLKPLFNHDQTNESNTNNQNNQININTLPQFYDESDSQIKQSAKEQQNRVNKQIIESANFNQSSSKYQAQKMQKLSEGRVSSSFPQDESKLEMGLRDVVIFNYQDNSRLDNDTREIEEEKSNSLTKFKNHQNDKIKQKQYIDSTIEEQKSKVTNKTMVLMNSQQSFQKQLKKRGVSNDNNDYDDLSSNKIIDLQKHQKSIIDQNSLAPQAQYLIEKLEVNSVGKPIKKLQNNSIKQNKLQVKKVQKRQNLHIPIYDISTGIVQRQFQNKQKVPHTVDNTKHQTNILALTQQIAQAILIAQQNSPQTTQKMNVFNLDPNYYKSQQNQAALNSSIYSSQLDESIIKHDQQQSADQNMKTKDILLKLEENLSTQNDYYGNTQPQQQIKFNSVIMSSKNINSSEQVVRSNRDNADSMRNVHQDYIPNDQHYPSPLYMVTPGRSTNVQYNSSIGIQPQIIYNQMPNLQPNKIESNSFQFKLDEQQTDDQKMFRVINQQEEIVNGNSRNNIIKNAHTLQQGINTESLGKEQDNMEEDNNDSTYGNYQNINSQQPRNVHKSNDQRIKESPYASENKHFKNKQNKEYQNTKYGDSEVEEQKTNLIVLDDNPGNFNNKKTSIPTQKIEPQIEFQKINILSQNDNYYQNKNSKVNSNQSKDVSIAQQSDEITLARKQSFDKSYFKLNERKNINKLKSQSRGSQDFTYKNNNNQSFKNNQDLQHAVSFLNNDNKKQFDQSSLYQAQKDKAYQTDMANLKIIKEQTSQNFEQYQDDKYFFSNRQNILILGGAQISSNIISANLNDKSKESQLNDHNSQFEKNLQSKFIQQTVILENGQEVEQLANDNQKDLKNTKNQTNNKETYKQDLQNNKTNNQQQTPNIKYKNKQYGGGYNNYAQQNRIEETKVVSNQAKPANKQASLSNQNQQKAHQNTQQFIQTQDVLLNQKKDEKNVKKKNESVEILMSLIQQTNKQNLDSVQKVLINMMQNINQNQIPQIAEQQEQKLVLPETILLNSTLFSQSPRMNETKSLSFQQLNLDQTIQLNETMNKDQQATSQNSIQQFKQVVDQYNNQEQKQDIKKMINDLYKGQQKYQRRLLDRNELINTCDFIFDLNKAKGIIKDKKQVDQEQITLQINSKK